MSGNADLRYEFCGLTLDPDRRLLFRDHRRVPLSPKTFDLLHVLVRHQGKLLSRDDLIGLVWQDSVIEEGNLSVGICHLRKILGEKRGKSRCIQTVSKFGYRFVAPVAISESTDSTGFTQMKEESTAPVECSPELMVEALPEFPVPAGHTSLRSWLRPLVDGLTLAAVVLLPIYFLSPQSGPASGVDAGEVRSLAVLPFQTSGFSRNDAFLGLGTADALITRLGREAKFKVRATSSIEKYQQQSLNPLTAGKEQAVDAVLSGQIVQNGDQATLHVQLTRVRDGRRLWEDTFSEKYQDAFALEDQASDHVADAIGSRVSASNTDPSGRPANGKL